MRGRERARVRAEGGENVCNVEEAIWLETYLFPGQYNQLSWTTRSTGAKSQGRCTEGNILPLLL